MKHCVRCAMPDTRPGTLFNDEGVCQACLNYEKRKEINWGKREEELRKLCDKYRRDDGYYDCLIPVSGGKDSHYQVYTMKEEMGMNPLLITVGDPFTKSQAGVSNLRNLSDSFGCDHILYTISIPLFKKVTRIAFEEFGAPLKYVETAICTVPFKMAIKLGIPLVVYGESEYEYGSWKGTPSINEFISRKFKEINLDFWLQKGIPLKELNAIIPPSEKERLDVMVLSYFKPWSSTRNLEIAKRYGFRDLHHEWQREGYIDNFEQIDSLGYLVHLWLKYPKFGFQRTSDIASRRVREGELSLSEAKKLIMEHDHKLDWKTMDDFINCLGYTPKQFWDIVERFWNRELFEKVDGVWRLKDHVYKDY